MTTYSLKSLSYFATGGECSQLHHPTSLESLQEIIHRLSASKTQYFLLGAGSNSLVSDSYWSGAVISLHRLKQITCDGEKLTALAGVSNTEIAIEALKNGVAGAAWMNRLPGQIGATVRMNARCYGGEISQIAEKITTVTPSGKLAIYHSNSSTKSVFRAYKDTIFMQNNEIVAKVELRLKNCLQETIKTKMDYCENDRQAKMQFEHPSCGCVFKNSYHPEVSISSGLLLEAAGAKNLVYPNCRVSNYHANFINNLGASSQEILELSYQMQELVWIEFGVWLEYEMEVLGYLPPELEKRFREKRKSNFQTKKLDHLRKEFLSRQKTLSTSGTP